VCGTAAAVNGLEEGLDNCLTKLGSFLRGDVVCCIELRCSIDDDDDDGEDVVCVLA
jgi:hypothetical protein